jgi:hypothetical protein
VVAFGSGEGWQVHDVADRRTYLSSDERVRFLRVADGLAPRMRELCYMVAYAGYGFDRRRPNPAQPAMV